MAIKHVVTLGFGFADGVAFIPTIGFTPSTVTTPIRILTLFDWAGTLTLGSHSSTLHVLPKTATLTVDDDE